MAVAASDPFAKAGDLYTAGLARWGLYGREGVGKSTFLSTLCHCVSYECQCEDHKNQCVPLVVVSADQENIKPYHGKRHIRVYKVQRWDQITNLYLRLAKGGHPYKAVGFDTWTRLQALAARKISGDESLDIDKAVAFLQRAPKTPQGWNQWSQIGALAADGMRVFNLLEMHTIYLLQEREFEPETMGDGATKTVADWGVFTIGPDLTPSALKQVRVLLELLGRLYVDLDEGDELDVAAMTPRAINPNAKEVRRLLLGKHPTYASKGPTHLLGYTVEDPTWDKLAKSLV